MRYKSITLRLLEQNPEIFDLLLRTHTLLPTLARFAKELKASHERWKDQLSSKDGSESRIASEALENAVKELEDRLASDEPFSLADVSDHIHPPPPVE